MAVKGTENVSKQRNVLPIYIKEEEVDERCRVVDMCRACESVSGKGSIDGATKINRLWRVLPYNETSRATLLTNGMVSFGRRITFQASNPYVSVSGDGEAMGTKMTISGLPFSYSNEAVERNLIKAGFKPLGKITWMKARDRQGHLTDWRDGRRVIWIEIPNFKHANKLTMGSFSALIHYREMPIICFKCREEGHAAKDCKKEMLCFVCKKPGHKKGDPVCEGKPRARKSMVWDLDGEESKTSSMVSNDEEASGSDSEVESYPPFKGSAFPRGRRPAYGRGGSRRGYSAAAMRDQGARE